MMRLFLFLFIPVVGFSAQLSPSLLMFHEWDFNACPERIEKVLDLNPSHIQILISGHHEADKQKSVINYRYYADNGNFEKLNQAIISRFQRKIKTCFEKVPNDIKIAITLHLNDSQKTSYWRNFIKFDPLKKMNGFSYYDFLIKPVVQSLKELKKENVNISLQGEMGATVFSYPKSYAKIITRLKKDHPQWDFGISLNFNKINGGVESFDKQEVQKLLEMIDFFGFSAYQPFDHQFIFSHFKRTSKNFLNMLKKLEVKLPSSTPLHFREVGIGGGNELNDGSSHAITPKEAATHPYAGAKNPWKSQKMRDFRIRFHKELIRYLKRQMNFPNPVTEAYLWNTGSWDPLNLYPFTEPFEEQEVINALMNQ